MRRERRELRRNDVEDRSLEAWTAAIRGSEGMSARKEGGVV
jgi:hypothetical protein